MIRVLRIMEYVYGSPEEAEADMGRWYVPANGTKTIGIGPTRSIKSATIMNLNFKAEEESTDA